METKDKPLYFIKGNPFRYKEIQDFFKSRGIDMNGYICGCAENLYYVDPVENKLVIVSDKPENKSYIRLIKHFYTEVALAPVELVFKIGDKVIRKNNPECVIEIVDITDDECYLFNDNTKMSIYRQDELMTAQEEWIILVGNKIGKVETIFSSSEEAEKYINEVLLKNSGHSRDFYSVRMLSYKTYNDGCYPSKQKISFSV